MNNYQKLYLSRRKFLGLVGAGTAATFFTSPAWAAFELSPDELEQWQSSLIKPASPRLYLSSKHTDARLHLGGIGTGNFEIGADGQLTTWQLFNTLRDGDVPFYFGVKSGETAKLLQTAGGPDWPRIKQIEMTGEYPFCTLRFKDDDLPVQLELEAFTPMEPLNTKLSSMPLAVFKFRIHNPISQPQTISLAAMLANPVGYAGIGKIEGNSHPSLGFNVNETFREGDAGGLLLGAKSGNDPDLDKPVSLFLLKDLFAIPPEPGIENKNYASIDPREFSIPPLDRPENLKVEVIRANTFSNGNFSNASQSVIWLEDAPANLSGELLSEMQNAVKAGAILIFSGDQMPLLKNYATVTAGKSFSEAATRPEIVFEDFENGYGKWTVEGDAFGHEPEHGTLPGQQPVSGFIGKGLVNSFVGGDDTTGKLTSQTFTIEKKFHSLPDRRRTL